MSDKNYEPLVAALRGAENKNGLIISSAQFIEMCADTIEHLSMDKERDDKIIASLQKELVEAAKGVTPTENASVLLAPRSPLQITQYSEWIMAI